MNLLLGDSALLNAAKKNGMNANALLGNDSSAAFKGLMNALVKARKGEDVSKILTSTPTASVKKPLDGLTLTLPAEFIEALKGLSPEDLKKLPPEIATLLRHYIATENLNDEQTLNILEALSTAPAMDDGETPDLYTIISDPKLADFLAGMAAKAKTGDDVAAADGATSKPFSSFVLTGLGAPIVMNVDVQTTGAGKQEIVLVPAKTITIADLDMDGFQALKKLAFADIAPYLTTPRAMRLDSNNVVKVAQGPSFLNEENTDATLMNAIAGLMSVLPASMLGANMNNSGDTPAFLNPPAAASSGKTAKPADIFASLLGLQLPPQTPASPHTPATATPATDAAQVAPDMTMAKTIVPTPAVSATPSPLMAATAAASHVSAAPAVMQALKGLDSALNIEGDGLGDFSFDAAMHIHADQTLPGNTSTSLISARGAGQTHPATYMVSVALQRATADGINPAGSEKIFVIQMDPPNLGRVKITLEFGENNSVKAKILAERPETVSMLQKDAGVLERALQGSGFDTDRGSLSFDLAGGDSFSQSMSQGGHQGGKQGSSDDGTDFATIETVMSIFVDPETGLTHVNVVI
jgi:flagellar hook-length control protein FliK